MTWSERKILVAGLGGSGRAMLAYLYRCGARPAVYDARGGEIRQALADEFPGTVCYGGTLEEALAHGFDVLAVSPGIDRRQPAVRAFERGGGEVVGDVEILARLLAGRGDKVIAVTGSNGKTTVTSLVGHLCAACGKDTVVAGNIGLPVLEAEMRRNGRPADFWVLELSSFQLESSPSLNAVAAVCLNVSEDHLERYDDFLDYAHAKTAVFKGSGVQVLNADDVFCRAMRRAGRVQKWFSLERPADYWLDGTGYLKAGDAALIRQSGLPLNGRHNAANVLAALALCEAAGLPRDGLLAGLASFRGLPHRVETVAEKNGVVFIDDSKGTNVGATAAALAGLDGPLLVILGGQGKGQDFAPLRGLLAAKARAVLLIGEDAGKIRADLTGFVPQLSDCADLEEAVRTAYALAAAGDTVLLSPACASLDMFSGYAHRAEVFRRAVDALP